MVCPDFWLKDPAVLWRDAGQFFPFTAADQRCTASALNSFTRFGLYLAVLLALIRMEPRWLVIGVLFAIFAVGAWFYMGGRGTLRELFMDGGGGAEVIVEHPTEQDVVTPAQLDGRYVPDVIGADRGMRTEPTAANPFMNVLVSEISDNPYRAPAAAVRADLDQYFDTMFASNPGDVFNRSQSQRMWVAQPSTTVPNDQESFQNWLFRVPGRTCKEHNGAACNPTADGLMPWREIGAAT
jgi:hypothetical protein